MKTGAALELKIKLLGETERGAETCGSWLQGLYWASSVCLAWELVRNAESLASPASPHIG